MRITCLHKSLNSISPEIMKSNKDLSRSVYRFLFCLQPLDQKLISLSWHSLLNIFKYPFGAAIALLPPQQALSM